MLDYLYLGSVPSREDCVSVDEGEDLMRAETMRYVRGLSELYPDAEIELKWFNHEFGRYCEAVAYYDDYVECQTPDDCEGWGECDCQSESFKLALEVEHNLPKTWQELHDRIYTKNEKLACQL